MHILHLEATKNSIVGSPISIGKDQVLSIKKYSHLTPGAPRNLGYNQVLWNTLLIYLADQIRHNFTPISVSHLNIFSFLWQVIMQSRTALSIPVLWNKDHFNYHNQYNKTFPKLPLKRKDSLHKDSSLRALRGFFWTWGTGTEQHFLFVFSFVQLLIWFTSYWELTQVPPLLSEQFLSLPFLASLETGSRTCYCWRKKVLPHISKNTDSQKEKNSLIHQTIMLSFFSYAYVFSPFQSSQIKLRN